jgi:hypothetical protein
MLRQIGLFFCISIVSFSAFAEDEIRYYDIEFILFEHTDSKNRQAEDWQARRLPAESEQAELSHELGQPFMIEAESPYDPESMFTLLPDQDKKLLDDAKLIEKSQNRRILAHLAWRQPGLPKEQAIWVQFKKQLASTASDDTSVVKPSDLISASSETTSIDFLTGKQHFQPYVEGKIKVMLARYLHVDTHIMYFATPAPSESEKIVNHEENTVTYSDIELDQENDEEPEVFLLKQLRRRIRSTELHYLDNPVMGMLLLITPYEKPEQPDQTTNVPTGYKTLPE